MIGLALWFIGAYIAVHIFLLGVVAFGALMESLGDALGELADLLYFPKLAALFGRVPNWVRCLLVLGAGVAAMVAHH